MQESGRGHSAGKYIAIPGLIIGSVFGVFIYAAIIVSDLHIIRNGEIATGTVTHVWERARQHSDIITFELPDGRHISYLEIDSGYEVGETEEIIFVERHLREGEVSGVGSEAIPTYLLPLIKFRIIAIPALFLVLFVGAIIFTSHRLGRWIAHNGTRPKRMKVVLVATALSMAAALFMLFALLYI